MGCSCPARKPIENRDIVESAGACRVGAVRDNLGVEVDLSRLPTGSTGWQALVDHALSLGDLSEVGYLELKGTLPFGERASRKRSAV